MISFSRCSRRNAWHQHSVHTIPTQDCDRSPVLIVSRHESDRSTSRFELRRVNHNVDSTLHKRKACNIAI